MTKDIFPFESAPGATPLDPNEIEGLRVDSISTQGELNRLEQENILKAKAWVFGKKHKNILTDTFLRELHKRMFKDVWKWAGKYRISDKSIGVTWSQIPTALINLLDDTDYWIKNKTYPWDELGARFHHRLVKIHPFTNGNGRHARLMTDLILTLNGQIPFTWGASLFSDGLLLDNVGRLREEYILSLREADNKKYARLIKFVRS